VSPRSLREAKMTREPFQITKRLYFANEAPTVFPSVWAFLTSALVEQGLTVLASGEPIVLLPPPKQ
jgi:hypothetical protein